MKIDLYFPNNQKIKKEREFPGGPVVKNPPYNGGTQVRPLVRELRSHMPRGN